jgi:hypothetical protein
MLSLFILVYSILIQSSVVTSYIVQSIYTLKVGGAVVLNSYSRGSGREASVIWESLIIDHPRCTALYTAIWGKP